MNRQDAQANRTLLDVFELLLRHRWRFVVPAFLIMLVALAASLMLPRKYQGHAIFEQRVDMVLSEMMHRGAPRTMQDPRQSLVQALNGQASVDQTIEALTPELQAIAAKTDSRIDIEELKSDVGRKVVVEFDIASNVVNRPRITYVHENPEVARLVVNGLVNNYMERTRDEIEQRLRLSEAFFSQEVQRGNEKIEEAEQRKLAFEIQNASLLAENDGGVQNVSGDIQLQLVDLEHKLESANRRSAMLRESLDNTPKNVPSVVNGRNPERQRLEKQLREQQSQLALFTNTYKMTDRHPELQDLREQIEATQQAIAETPAQIVIETSTAANPRHAELTLMLATSETDRETLQRQISATRTRLADLHAQSVNVLPVRAEYRKLVRETEQLQREVAFWEDNLRRVGMTMSAESGNRGLQMNFIRPCPVLTRPVSPDLAQVIMAAVVLGLIGGALCAFIAHRTDESFHDADALAASVELPLLGSVSELMSKRQRHLRSLRKMVIYPVATAAMIVVLAGVVGLVYMNLKHPEELSQFTQNPVGFITQQAQEQAPAALATTE